MIGVRSVQDERDIAAQRQIAANALANIRLAGLEHAPQVLAEMERVVLGEWAIDEVMASDIERVKRSDLRG